jgi:hypothetical protein
MGLMLMIVCDYLCIRLISFKFLMKAPGATRTCLMQSHCQSQWQYLTIFPIPSLLLLGYKEKHFKTNRQVATVLLPVTGPSQHCQCMPRQLVERVERHDPCKATNPASSGNKAILSPLASHSGRHKTADA